MHNIVFSKIEDLIAKVKKKLLAHMKKNLEKNLIGIIEGEITEDILEVLLKLMSIVLFFDNEYKKNIKDFNAVYVFKSKDDSMYTSAIFKKNKMKVSNKKQEEPTFTLIFKDNQSLIKFLFSGTPDILDALLNQEVDFNGNINYINKFAFMALHLVNNITGGMNFAKDTVNF